MRQLDEVDVADEKGFAGEGLALGGGGTAERRNGGRLVHRVRSAVPPFRRSANLIPSRGHISSTRRFVSSSISIRSGHSRSNPSSFHFRVASIPILLP